MNEEDFDREFVVKQVVEDMILKNKDILDRLGSDYDESGIPYWEKNDTGK